jgi:hypothetical protein
MDVEKIIEEIAGLARKNLDKDGYLTPIALLFNDGQFVMPIAITWDDDESKRNAYGMVGEEARKRSADSVILINDVAMRPVKSVEDFKYMEKNYETERPTAYPESLRKEMIVIGYIDFNTLKYSAWCQEYKKEGEQRIYGELSREDNLIGVMPESVIAGFKRGVRVAD